MSIWKPALIAAALVAAGCQPVGAPLGEKRVAEKIADNLINDEILAQFVRQQVQGLMYQGSVSQDQVGQVAIAISRDMRAKLPEIKQAAADGLVREFNIKELEFFLKLLTSPEAKSVMEKQEAAMTDAIGQIEGLSREAATRALGRVTSAWPTGAPPAPEQPPQPPGMVLPN